MVAVAACNGPVLSSYLHIQTIKDQDTGKFVELGELVSMSSWCLVVNVFSDDNPTRKAWESKEPVILICNLDPGHELKFVIEDGCYTLMVGYGSGGMRQSKWLDPVTEKEICFTLRNIPG